MLSLEFLLMPFLGRGALFRISSLLVLIPAEKAIRHCLARNGLQNLTARLAPDQADRACECTVRACRAGVGKADLMRGFSVALLALFAACPLRAEIVSAEYADPTARYRHGILGDAIEWGTLQLSLRDGKRLRIVLPETRVFEDTAPRLADLNGDSRPEVIVVESSNDAGARLAVYGEEGLIAATPFLGRPNRWLAPIGAADFTSDGKAEIAYVETPHLTGSLRVVELRGDKLVPIAGARGLTNHRIGDREILSGIRNCGRGPEMILTSFPWQRSGVAEMLAVELTWPELQVVAWRFEEDFTPAHVMAALDCGLQPDYLK
ncbi:VCBS repeat-containing protein [Hydrogenophaga sp. 5NK40-0174]|uniref:FG-GAP repeat domain-containing protein n=1 Tax=Hydrogenophaga sp. 5NK40-0174 TaxID=3127649 RepID=UPI003102B72C